jgi:uncharacterized phage protein (TIGR01671 family)
MREIKFRAWEKNLKEIIPVDSISFGSRMINTNSAWRFFDEIELMQYTGLEDKNGKEIYEGDIVSTESYETAMMKHWGKDFESKQKHYGIRYERASFRLYDLKTDLWIAVLDHHVMSKVESLEVIGNIYENPELLEGDN